MADEPPVAASSLPPASKPGSLKPKINELTNALNNLNNDANNIKDQEAYKYVSNQLKELNNKFYQFKTQYDLYLKSNSDYATKKLLITSALANFLKIKEDDHKNRNYTVTREYAYMKIYDFIREKNAELISKENRNCLASVIEHEKFLLFTAIINTKALVDKTDNPVPLTYLNLKKAIKHNFIGEKKPPTSSS